MGAPIATESRGLCILDECGRPLHAAGLCATHYTRRRLGLPFDAPIKPQRPAGTLCAFEGCENPRQARGLCQLHYKRQRKGTPIGRPNLRAPAIERFWRQTERTDRCWLWTGQSTRTGYGIVKVDGLRRRVHRVAYELLVGPVPDGLELDHLCAVRNCWNPEHLEAVTHAENTRRAWARKVAVLNRPVGDLLD